MAERAGQSQSCVLNGPQAGHYSGPYNNATDQEKQKKKTHSHHSLQTSYNLTSIVPDFEVCDSWQPAPEFAIEILTKLYILGQLQC